MSHKGALATEGNTWATLTYFPLPRKKNLTSSVESVPEVLAASATLRSNSMGVWGAERDIPRLTRRRSSLTIRRRQSVDFLNGSEWDCKRETGGDVATTACKERVPATVTDFFFKPY